jgi:hypothetical protein
MSHNPSALYGLLEGWLYFFLSVHQLQLDFMASFHTSYIRIVHWTHKIKLEHKPPPYSTDTYAQAGQWLAT